MLSFDCFRRLCFMALVLVLAQSLLAGCALQGFGVREAMQKKPVHHLVRSGETLQSVAKRYGVSVSSLMLLNGLRGSSSVAAGQRLLVGYRSVSVSDDDQSEPIERTSMRGDPSTRISQGRLAWPIHTGYIVSQFGPRDSGFHDGLDIAAPSGVAVFAAQSGVVIYAGNAIAGYGNLLIIRGDDRLTTIYAHNEQLLVEEGKRVARGQQVAEVGSTGHANGSHLHFEVRMRDSRGRHVAVDPLPLLSSDEKNPRPRYRVNDSLAPVMARYVR